jgi:glycosyltransferase involved in cell wall biosynthesis
MTISSLEKPALKKQVVSPSSSRSFRILFLAPFAPHLQASHGGGRVIAQLIAHLARRHSIGLCYLRAAGEPAVDDVLRERCAVIEEVVITEPEDTGLNRWLHRLRVWKELMMGRPLWAIDRYSPAYSERVKRLLKTWRPDIVQIEFHIMGQYISVLADYPAPRILVQHEPGMESARELINTRFTSRRIVPQLDLLAWKRFEREVTRQVQAVVVFTRRDHEAVSRLGLQTNIVQIPPGTEIPETVPQELTNESLSLLFIGNYKHLPNVDAADRLVNNIFPRVQSRFPEARLFIVGEHLPSTIMHKPNESVTLTGYVPDVKPYLEKTTLVVVPVRLGGGMRIKVLEALAAGKPVVASARAVEGLDLMDGEQVVLAKDDNDFARAIIDLLGNPDKRVSLAAQAQAWARANLSWEKTVADYDALYHRLFQDYSRQVLNASK